MPLEKFGGQTITAKSAIIPQHHNEANQEHYHDLAAQRMDPNTFLNLENNFYVIRKYSVAPSQPLNYVIILVGIPHHS